jgi:DNA-binding SARP family transcriptional activator
VKTRSGRAPGPDRPGKFTGTPLTRCVRVLNLGPLAVLADGEVREIPGRLPQTLLRVLAREPGRSVPVAALVDALWGEDPPRRADAVIEQHVWRLRKVIEPGRRSGDPPRVLVRTAGGYALRVSAEDVDSVRQAALVNLGGEHLAAGRALAALECFAAAEALWRGSPAGLPSTGGEGWLARLGEVRLAAVERVVDAELALGRTAGALARLDGARVELPFHEGLWERRMLALYRLGRQAEALAAFREIRDLLAAELGVDPGPGLRALHARILRQDPALLASARAGVAGQVGGGVLPAWLTSFVGREAEVASLARLLRQHRLVTVVGAGGTGKTRLAVETARVVAGEFPDGVAFADLVPVIRPEAVAEAVLAAASPPESGTRIRTGGTCWPAAAPCPPPPGVTPRAGQRRPPRCPGRPAPRAWSTWGRSGWPWRATSWPRRSGRYAGRWACSRPWPRYHCTGSPSRTPGCGWLAAARLRRRGYWASRTSNCAASAPTRRGR